MNRWILPLWFQLANGSIESIWESVEGKGLNIISGKVSGANDGKGGNVNGTNGANVSGANCCCCWKLKGPKVGLFERLFGWIVFVVSLLVDVAKEIAIT